MANIATNNSNGLFNSVNSYSRNENSLWQADNVVSKRGVIERRFGFRACSEGLPDKIPQQMYSFKDKLIVHIDGSLYYEDSNCNFVRIPSAVESYFEGRAIAGNHVTSAPYDYEFCMVEGVQTAQRVHILSRVRFDDGNLFGGALGTYEILSKNVPETDTPARTSVDGPLVATTLNAPNHLCYCSANGKYYIADSYSSTVRSYDPLTGIITTVSGKLYTVGNVDGAVGVSRLTSPCAVFYNQPDNSVYLIEGEFNILGVVIGPLGTSFRFKKIDIATNITTTIAANMIPLAINIGSRISFCRSMFSTNTSNYVYSNYGNRFRRGAVTSLEPSAGSILKTDKTTGTTTELCGLFNTTGIVFGNSANTRMRMPGQLAGDQNNEYLYYAQDNCVVRVSVSTGSTEMWLGNVSVYGVKDGSGVNCLLDSPSALFCYDDGYMIIVCKTTVRKVFLSTAECVRITDISTDYSRVNGFLGYPILKVPV